MMRTAVLALAILLGAAANAAATSITYSINMWGSINGSPITNIVILERNGAQLSVDTSASFVLNVPGTATLTHDVAFTPTETLILGLDVPSGPDGTTHVMFIADPTWAWSHVNMRFRDVFNIGYVDFRSAVLDASNGNLSQQAFLLNFFANGTGAPAAFDSDGASQPIEFSVSVITPEPSTFVLVGLGAALVASRLRRKARQ